MDSLSTGQDLLPTHEHVVRVRPLRIVRVGHGVERPHGQGELVQDVEVCVVLGLDEAAEQLLVGGGQVLVVLHLDPGLPQHGHALGILQPQGRVQKLERLGRVLLIDSIDFFGEIIPQPLKKPDFKDISNKYWLDFTLKIDVNMSPMVSTTS